MRRKRSRRDAIAFRAAWGEELVGLFERLRSGSYAPEPGIVFVVDRPKYREVHAAAFRDRVVHHALCQVIEPVFERGFIFSSYANRVGKGTHAALDRATYYARRYPYALKCDIEKYFPTIDHELLLERIARKIKCRDTLWLIERIVANSNPQEEVVRYSTGDSLFTPLDRRRGIPIGNLTSQFFANIFLDSLDHFVQERLGHAAYLRFADDFVIFAQRRETLSRLLPELRSHLEGLRLRLHPTKCHVLPVRTGVPFLGWQVFPTHRRLRRRTGIRLQRRLRARVEAHNRGQLPFERVWASMMSSIGHLKHGDTWGLRTKLMDAAALRPAKVQGE